MTTEVEPIYGLDGQPVDQPNDPDLSTSEVVEFPEAEQKQMQQAVISLELLRDLKFTIAKRGVSQDDIRSVFEIRSSLEAIGIESEVVPSLEQYGTLSYTEERSGVNLRVATESIGTTIANVIKAMIKKLIEYIAKMVQWFRKTFMGEKALQAQLSSTVKVVETLRDKNREFIREYGQPKDYDKLSQEYVTEVLTKHGLRLSPITFALLGDQAARRELDDVLVRVNEFLAVPPSVAKFITDFLEEKVQEVEMDVTDTKLARIGWLLVEYERLDVEVPDAQSALRRLGPGALDIRLHPLLTGVTPYDTMVLTYDYINDTLKRVRAYTGNENVEGLTEVVNGLSKAVDNMAKVASHIYDLNRRKINLLKLFYLYENMRFTLLFRYAKEQFVGGDKEERIEKFAEELKKLLKSSLA